MSAGQSPAGSAFAARHADLQFIFLHDLSRTAELVATLKARALAEHGRELKVMSLAYVVCRDSEQEARDYYQYYVHEVGDWQAARNLVAGASQNLQSADTTDPAVLEALVAGYGALPLVGTPDQIAARIAELAAAGLDGLTLSWVDYAAGIAQYEQQLLPRLRALGLRH